MDAVSAEGIWWTCPNKELCCDLQNWNWKLTFQATPFSNSVLRWINKSIEYDRIYATNIQAENAFCTYHYISVNEQLTS